MPLKAPGRSFRRLRRPSVLFEPVAAFRQVQRGAQVGELGHGQGDAHDFIGAGIDLFQRDAILEGRDRHIVLKVIRPLVDEVITVASNSCSMVNMGRDYGGAPGGSSPGLRAARSAAAFPLA